MKIERRRTDKEPDYESFGMLNIRFEILSIRVTKGPSNPGINVPPVNETNLTKQVRVGRQVVLIDKVSVVGNF